MTVPQMKANTGHHSESVLQGYIDQSERTRLIAASAVACECDMPTIHPPSVSLWRHDEIGPIVGMKRSLSAALMAIDECPTDKEEEPAHVASVVIGRGGSKSSSSSRSSSSALAVSCLHTFMKMYNDAFHVAPLFNNTANCCCLK